MIKAREDSRRPGIHVLAYGPDGMVEDRVEKVHDIRRLEKQWPVVWIDCDGPPDNELAGWLQETYGLHPLAVEDVLHGNQRPKVDFYDDHLFVVITMPSRHEESMTEQVSLFVGDGFVLSFQERPGDCFAAVRDRVRIGRVRIRTSGADYLAYALIDAVVDAYFPLLEEIGERIETLEREILQNPDRDLPTRIQVIRSELREYRRANAPHRDVISTLLHPETPVMEVSTDVFLRDCLDHTVRISEWVESYREETSDLMNTYMSSLSNKMNEVMKVLTIMAAIFIPLTFIAGIYGMNFDPEASAWNMPELSSRWGYPVTLGVMGLVAAGMLLYFKSRDWFR